MKADPVQKNILQNEEKLVTIIKPNMIFVIILCTE